MRQFKLLIVAALFGAITAAPGLANDTTFTYQGSLKDGGGPANGFYDMTFHLYSALSGGSLLGTVGLGVQATDGVFTAELDFGAADFNNSDRWLQIVVNGSTLSPRQPVTRTPYAIQTRGIFVDDDGHVGMGGTLTSANELLTIRDPDASLLLLSQSNNFGPHITMRNTASGTVSVHGQIRFDDGSQLASIGYSKQLGSPEGLAFGDAVGTKWKMTQGGFIGMGGELNPLGALHIQPSGDFLDPAAIVSDDIIVEAPDAVLGLYSTDGGSRGSAIALGEIVGGVFNDQWSIGRNTSPDSALYIKYGFDPSYAANETMFAMGTDGLAYFLGANPRLGIGTPSPAVALHVVGNARVNVLEVIGADLAERFPITDEAVIEPGMVVEIDPENPGALRLASSAYSRLVAGIVSGANGLPAGTVMGNLPGSEGSPAIALTGRVWVQCDAGDRAIEPGDLLTTSSTPGHAMSVTDHSRAMGSVIGKAMTRLDNGETGMVLVLVGLQ